MKTLATFWNIKLELSFSKKIAKRKLEIKLCP